MCVLALAWRANPKWRLVAAGNRDELHARPALPLAAWGNGVIAGRDAVGGGTWLGVGGGGRFAVVTNVRSVDGPDPDKASRGRLVSDLLTDGIAAAPVEALDAFNPFNLIAVDHDDAWFLTNRPRPQRKALAPGVHGLSNGLFDRPWPKTRVLEAAVADWLAAGDDDVAPLFAALADETPFAPPDGEDEPVGSPIFIRNARYGTRCSTVVTVDHEGLGMIAERRFDPAGEVTGETRLGFAWAG